LVKEYCEKLANRYGNRLRSICLFGSIARGEDDPESDVDVLVVIEGLSKDMGDRFREANDLFGQLKTTSAYRAVRNAGRNAFISDIFLTPNEVETHPPILLDIVSDGIILYDKEEFLQRVLSDIKARLDELGARRVKAKKGYYWILKPDAKFGEVVQI
jgi:hypothetical protein